MKLKLLFALFAILAAAMASAVGTLTVTSPTEGAFLGRQNTVRFQISGATVEVQVKVELIQGGVTKATFGPRPFTPDNDGNINNSITVNIAQNFPEGVYQLKVSATEAGVPYTPVTLNVNVDVTDPKFFDLNPTNNSFVKGPNVPIIVKVIDANFKEYRVQIGGEDIPNNTGTELDANNTFTVDWDTSGVLQDGQKQVTVTVKDQADNTKTQTFNVTIDRIAPTTTIQFPRSDTAVRPRSNVSVVVDVRDASGTSVGVTGVDVVIRDMNDNFIMRVPRTSFQSQGSNTVRWSGRIRSNITLPRNFKVVATAVDKAGNVAVPQITIAHVG